MATEQLTLYTAKICPYAHRVELALEEAKAPYEKFQVNLQNKPSWYAPQVNPASKVPAIAYGGPKVSPDHPSPASTKIAESLVLLEFIADLYPDARLLPPTPVARARARFFIDAVSTRIAPANITASRDGNLTAVFTAIDTLQGLLPPQGYALGEEWSIADAAVAPFLARLEVSLKNGAGVFDAAEGKKVYETLQTDPKYERYQRYFSDLKARDSFKNTFDEPYVTESMVKRFSALRAQKQVQTA